MGRSLIRLKGGFLLVGSLLAMMLVSACGAPQPSLAATSLTLNNTKAAEKSFSFDMVASPGINACLSHAHGQVTITPGSLNDKMDVSVQHLAPNTGYDLFVIELPNKPFGVSWYQSDLQTDEHGEGSASVRGIFDAETFSISPGGPSTTFGTVHQFHLGLWFNDPKVPFKLGCEPGKSQPVVTPFNGEQHAGIQVLNTANFSDNAGPLSKVHR